MKVVSTGVNDGCWRRWDQEARGAADLGLQQNDLQELLPMDVCKYLA